MKNKLGFLELYFAFFKVGLFAIGGGYTMLPIILSEVVVKKTWTIEEEVVDSYALAQSVPGIVAINTAALLGFKLSKLKGAFAFVLGVITPSFIIILLIAQVYNNMSENALVAGALSGIRIAILALLIATTIDLIKKSITDYKGILLAVSAFFALIFAHVSAVIVIFAGVLISALLYYRKE